MLHLTGRLVLALALVASVPAYSQDPDTEPDSSDTVETGPETSTEQPATPPSRDESPLDYESSEQISEDLSVSFPVDI